jgi:hypothetical protein
MLQQVVLETANPMTLEIGNADPNEILILTSISGRFATLHWRVCPKWRILPGTTGVHT